MLKKIFLTGCLLITLLLPQTSSSANLSKEIIPEGAEVQGFRSAQFGMTEKEVRAAILKDFKIKGKDVRREINSIEQTAVFKIDVESLLLKGMPAQVVYLFGYKSKKLIQVSIFWGDPVDPKPDAQGLVSLANVLRNHLAKKEFRKDKLLMNARLEDGSILVFRGTDKKGKMVMLLLKNPKNDGEKKKDVKDLKFSLRLFYIENPTDPDILKIKEKDF